MRVRNRSGLLSFLSGCLTILLGCGGGGGGGGGLLPPPDPGVPQALASGVFQGTDGLGVNATYSFQPGGVFLDSNGPLPPPGTWTSVGSSMASTLTQTVDVPGPGGGIIPVGFRLERTYNAAFTLQGGAKLLLGAFRKTAGNPAEVEGTYQAGETVLTTNFAPTGAITGTTWDRAQTVVFRADQTWELTTTITDTSRPPGSQVTVQVTNGSWAGAPFLFLVQFQGQTYLYWDDGRTWFRL